MPAQVLLLRRHGLFGGATGSGKSGGLNVLMGNLTACADVVIWAIDLKRGMELGPWASCIARLATTPAEARALLADAVAILEARAAHLAATGRRVWEPSPDMPALVIIIDEYAELAESAPEATGDADSIAPPWPRRRGHADRRHPAADAEGDGAGRAAVADGRADLLPRPRTPGRRPHPRPGHARRRLAGPHAQRARQVPDLRTRARHAPPRPRLPAHRPGRQRTASRHAHLRPALDEVSRRAVEERAQDGPGRARRPGRPTERGGRRDCPDDDPGAPQRRSCGPRCASPRPRASQCPS